MQRLAGGAIVLGAGDGRQDGLAEVEEPDVRREVEQAAGAAEVGVDGRGAAGAADLILELDREPRHGTLDAALERGGVDQEEVGPEERVGRLPGMVDHLALQQCRGHVDRPAAALDRGGRHERGVVVDAVIGPGADGVVDDDQDQNDQDPAEEQADRVHPPDRRRRRDGRVAHRRLHDGFSPGVRPCRPACGAGATRGRAAARRCGRLRPRESWAPAGRRCGTSVD